MLMLDRHIAVAAVLVLLIGAGIATCRGPALAQSGEHGDGHAINHDWYQNLTTPQGYSCCKGDAGFHQPTNLPFPPLLS